MFPSHFWIRKMRHQDSGRSIGRDQLMIVEAKHSQIMIVFLISIWTNSRRKFGIFIKVAVTRLFCTTVCRQAHWTRWSLLQVKFCSKGSHPPFTLAFSSLLPLLSPPSLPTFTKPEATLGVCQVNLKWRILWTNEKQMSFSSPVWWRKSWSIEANQRGLTMWPRIIHRQMQKSITTLSHIEIQKLTLYKTVTWRHCVSVVVCYWALPKMSISMQSNESTRFIMYIPGIHKVALKPPWIP